MHREIFTRKRNPPKLLEHDAFISVRQRTVHLSRNARGGAIWIRAVNSRGVMMWGGGAAGALDVTQGCGVEDRRST